MIRKGYYNSNVELRSMQEILVKQMDRYYLESKATTSKER